MGARARGGSADTGVAEIARMLGLLPAVLPASGRCAPLKPSDLSFSGHEPELVAPPVISTERLKTFPDIVVAPLALPPSLPSARSVRAHRASERASVPASAPSRDASPRAVSRAVSPRRRWAWALDVLVVVLVLGAAFLRSPLAHHPVARPYAEATTKALDRGLQASRPVAERALGSARGWVHEAMR